MRSSFHAPSEIQTSTSADAVNANQIIVAAEVTIDAHDFVHLEATLRELKRFGIDESPETVVAGAGYWHTTQMQAIVEQRIEVLIPPDGTLCEDNRPGWENGRLRAHARTAVNRPR